MTGEESGKIKIGVSSCLLGEKVRYDGGHKEDRYLTDVLSRCFEWVPLCPEIEAGLGTPREAMRLVGDPEMPRLLGGASGTDYTVLMKGFAEKRLNVLATREISGFIFKSNSPTSGAFRVKVYRENGTIRGFGHGLFAGAFMRRFPLVPVEEEERLHDRDLRENFIERVFSYHRLRQFFEGRPSRGEIVEFHFRQKLLLMAHSPAICRELGRMVAGIKTAKPAIFAGEYQGKFMAALSKPATPARHVNVMMHIMGYFRRELGPDDKKELLQLIGKFRIGLVPLVVPLTLLTHYIRVYGVSSLQNQYYLYPHPQELMLRNHV